MSKKNKNKNKYNEVMSADEQMEMLRKMNEFLSDVNISDKNLDENIEESKEDSEKEDAHHYFGEIGITGDILLDLAQERLNGDSSDEESSEDDEELIDNKYFVDNLNILNNESVNEDDEESGEVEETDTFGIPLSDYYKDEEDNIDGGVKAVNIKYNTQTKVIIFEDPLNRPISIDINAIDFNNTDIPLNMINDTMSDCLFSELLPNFYPSAIFTLNAYREMIENKYVQYDGCRFYFYRDADIVYAYYVPEESFDICGSICDSFGTDKFMKLNIIINSILSVEGYSFRYVAKNDDAILMNGYINNIDGFMKIFENDHYTIKIGDNTNNALRNTNDILIFDHDCMDDIADAKIEAMMKKSEQNLESETEDNGEENMEDLTETFNFKDEPEDSTGDDLFDEDEAEDVEVEETEKDEVVINSKASSPKVLSTTDENMFVVPVRRK